MKVLICVLYCLASSVAGQPVKSYPAGHKFPTKHIKHLEPVRNFQLSATSDVYSTHKQPYPDHMRVRFEAYGKPHHVELRLNKNIYADNAMEVVVDEQGNRKEQKPVVTSYHGSLQTGSAHLVLHHTNQTLEGFIATTDGLFTVQPLAHHADSILDPDHHTHLKSFSDVVIYNHADHTHPMAHSVPGLAVHPEMFAPSLQSIQEARAVEETTHVAAMSAGQHNRKVLQSLVPDPTQNIANDVQKPGGNWASIPRNLYRNVEILGYHQGKLVPISIPSRCYTGEQTPKAITANLLLHYTHAYQFKGNTLEETLANQRANLQSQFAFMNSLYGQQLRIQVDIGRVEFRMAPEPNSGGNGVRHWNAVSAALQFDGALDAARDYVASELRRNCPDCRNGMYHVLIKSDKPGNGIAYTRTACHNQGVSIGVSDSNLYWIVIGHEMGHQLGAGHSFERGTQRTGGIMDYVDEGRYPPPQITGSDKNGTVEFNPTTQRLNELCQYISGVQNRANCWAVAKQQPPLITCSPITPPPNSQVQYSAATRPIEAGMTALITCNLGYKINGVAKLSCGNNGKFSPETPTCDPIAVPTPAPRPDVVSAALTHTIDVETRYYLFKGLYFSVYGSQDSLIKGIPLPNYPKLIEIGFPGLGFKTVDAVLAASDDPTNGDFFFFSGNQYVKYRIFVGPHNNYPRPLSDFNPQWTSGGIDAATLLRGTTGYLFRAGECWTTTGSRCPSVAEMQVGIDSIKAIVSWEADRKLLIGQEKIVQYELERRNVVQQPGPNLFTIPTSSACSIMDCASCSAANTCNKCDPGYHGLYNFCHKDFFVSHLDFEGPTSSYTNAYTEVGFAQSPQQYNNQGVIGKSVVFDGKSYFKMKGFDMFWESFVMEMYIKPSAIRAMPIVSSKNPATGNTVKVSLDQQLHLGISISDLQLNYKLNEDNNVSIRPGEWSNIRIEFRPGSLVITVNGQAYTLNFRFQSGNIPRGGQAVRFSHWTLGFDEQTNSFFAGEMDQFELSGIPTDGVYKPAQSSGNIPDAAPPTNPPTTSRFKPTPRRPRGINGAPARFGGSGPVLLALVASMFLF
mmetsp:Transcript_21940/g.43567  ORF Transcript_21940/g.43567 Transcript_21940/m.43567 type:complete len:1075 (-) Transcript_21940:158-3382(-)